MKEVPIEFQNTMEYPSFWRYRPDGDLRHCQCVMDHGTFIEGDIPQCRGPRDIRSDLYCGGCEEDHGKVRVAALAEQERSERGT